MEKFKPDEAEIASRLSYEFELFIRGVDSINEETRRTLLRESKTYFKDRKVTGKAFIYAAVHASTERWALRNLRISQLWRDIAVANAAVSNEPHKAADLAINAFRKEFTVK